MIADFNWLTSDGVGKVIKMVYTILDIIRIVVPLGLVAMTTLDIAKKVINPDDKDGQQKIMIRALAALIVFLLPTLIKLVSDVAGLNDKKETITISENQNTPAPTKTEDPNKHISSLLLKNCPSETKKLHKGDTVTLTTNIPSTYTGNIKWSVSGGSNNVSLYEKDGGKTVQITSLGVTDDTEATIVIEADGRKNVCKLNLETEKLTSLEITNCPGSTQEYFVGDKVTLKSSIPSNFKRSIKWKVTDDSIDSIKIVGPTYEKDVTIEILSESRLTAAWIVVSADGISKACTININAIKDLKITNCPSPTTIFHVGDRITLNTNIPDTYKGSVSWSQSDTNRRTTVSQDGRELVVEITGVPITNSIPIAVSAHGGNLNDLCSIKVE